MRTVLHALKQARRDAIASAELTDAEMTLINSAEIPTKRRYSLKLVKRGSAPNQKGRRLILTPRE